MPIPDFVARLREHVGTDLLWLPGVAAVVVRPSPVDGTDEVLLVQRSDNQAWTVVTGILDPVEEPAVGAVREVLEETGVVARADRLVWAHTTSVIEYENGDQSAFLSLCFRCSWVEGEPVAADDESLDARWARVDELPAMSDGQRRRIELALANHSEAVFAT
ncbi:MAG: NUDIX domain-containing protein [Lapillicoccus sp.]